MTPACARSVLLAKASLESRGHKLVPWAVPNPKIQSSLLFRIMCIDGGRHIKSALDVDIMEPLNQPYPHFSLTQRQYTWGRHFAGLLGKPAFASFHHRVFLNAYTGRNHVKSILPVRILFVHRMQKEIVHWIKIYRSFTKGVCSLSSAFTYYGPVTSKVLPSVHEFIVACKRKRQPKG